MALSVRVTVGAPASDASRTSTPFRMNPTRLPSGEKNGCEAPSVPAIGVASSWSMRRSQRRVPASAGPMYASARPSSEIAMRAPPLLFGGCSAWLGLSARLNWLTGGTGAGRSQPQSAAAAVAARATPSAVTSTPGRRRAPARPAAADAGAAAAGIETVDVYDLSRSASANSAAVANRSAGSFSSAVITAASTWRGIVWRCGSIGRGVSVTTRATTAWAVLPVNGGSPVSISYSTAPRA